MALQTIKWDSLFSKLSNGIIEFITVDGSYVEIIKGTCDRLHIPRNSYPPNLEEDLFQYFDCETKKWRSSSKNKVYLIH